MHKRIIRIISSSHYLAHTELLFKQLRFLNIFDINTFQISSFIFDFFNNNLPQCFSNFFKENPRFHSHRTRSSHNVHIPYVQSTLAKQSLRYFGPVVWNSLPHHLRMTSSKTHFKQLLKQYFLDQK